MRCAQCQSEHPPGHRFCPECGAPLALSCAACGFTNMPDAKFCGGCGTALQRSEAAEKPASPPDEAIHSGELRQVTVLFADICDFTGLSSRLDPEEAHGLLSRFFEVADGAIERYGGTIDKHVGDCVMALFGAPLAHENDPERAVRAAVEIQAAVGTMCRDLPVPLRVHIGVASGQVMASGTGSTHHSTYTVTGASVNLASRLDDLAGPGETLISDAVYRAVATIADCAPLGEIGVEGLDRPVRTWRLERLRASAPIRSRRRFVGREVELQQFGALVAHCRDRGQGQAVFLRGEAGIGKSRLVEEFETIAGDRALECYKVRILDFGTGKGRDAVRMMVRQLLAIPAGSGLRDREAAAERAFAEALLDADQRVFLNDLLDQHQPTELRSMYGAMDNAVRNRGKRDVVTTLIGRLSARRPMMLTIEDLQWADSVTLFHLAAMTNVTRDSPVVMMLTSRTEGDPLDKDWRGAARGSRLLTLDLAPLRRDEAVALAGTFVDASDRFARECIERADGNPLFLEQLLHSADDADSQEVPGSIQSLVLARVDRLAPRDKQALQAASVIGQRFSLAALRHLIDDQDYDCGALTENDLIRPDEPEILFAHALIRDGVYSSLLKARKQELHRLAAAWFAERDLTLRAEHLDCADDEAAPAAYCAAAAALASGYRLERALQLAGRGLEIARVDVDLHALASLQGEIHRHLGQIESSIESYGRALETASDDSERCRAHLGLAAGMRVSDQYDQALASLSQAQEAAERRGLTLELSRTHYLRGNIYFPLGNLEGCLREHSRALEQARRAKSPDSEAQALSGLGDANYSTGRMITAHGYFERCIALCREHGLGRIEVGSQYMVAWTLLYRNQAAAATEEALAAVQAAVRVNDQRAEMVARLTAGRILVECGDVEGARAHVERGLEVADALGAKRFAPFLMIYLARIQMAEGVDPARRVALMQQAFETAQQTGPNFLGPWVLSTLALVAEDRDTAADALARGETLLRGDCVGHNYIAFYRDAMEVALRGADWDAALRYAGALEAYTAAEPLPWAAFFIRRARALAAHGRGDRDEATLEALQQLKDEATSLGIIPAVAAIERAVVA